jgi:hypothetical protein
MESPLACEAMGEYYLPKLLEIASEPFYFIRSPSVLNTIWFIQCPRGVTKFSGELEGEYEFVAHTLRHPLKLRRANLTLQENFVKPCPNVQVVAVKLLDIR